MRYHIEKNKGIFEEKICGFVIAELQITEVVFGKMFQKIHFREENGYGILYSLWNETGG